MSSSSFTTRRLNSSTFLLTEADVYGEHPLIYVKVHKTAPVIIVGDTGCDKPDAKHKHARFTHLRDYLESCPLSCNGDTPLNTNSERQYVIILSHCHYDHTLGVPQFLPGGHTSIIASAAGRDFIESDLAGHGLYRPIGAHLKPWKVTHWAQAFEKLQWPLKKSGFVESESGSETTDLGITIMQTPGHTPDELAWYDHDEMHLYVGDSFYERGPDGMDIIWPPQSSLVEWYYSLQKLRGFVRSRNARAADSSLQETEEGWITVLRRVKVGCGHQTAEADAEEIMAALEAFWWRVMYGDVPVVETSVIMGEVVDRWMERGEEARFSFRAPRRLMLDARGFFCF